MKRSFDLYFKDILRAIERIHDYTKDLDYEEFTKSDKTMDAVMRNLEIIGEAATQLSPELKEKYKVVPWKDIQDFRVVVAHHYWNVNTMRIWNIIESKLGELKQQMEGILEKELQENNK